MVARLSLPYVRAPSPKERARLGQDLHLNITIRICATPIIKIVGRIICFFSHVQNSRVQVLLFSMNCVLSFFSFQMVLIAQLLTLANICLTSHLIYIIKIILRKWYWLDAFFEKLGCQSL